MSAEAWGLYHISVVFSSSFRRQRAYARTGAPDGEL